MDLIWYQDQIKHAYVDVIKNKKSNQDIIFFHILFIFTNFNVKREREREEEGENNNNKKEKIYEKKNNPKLHTCYV